MLFLGIELTTLFFFLVLNINLNDVVSRNQIHTSCMEGNSDATKLALLFVRIYIL